VTGGCGGGGQPARATVDPAVASLVGSAVEVGVAVVTGVVDALRICARLDSVVGLVEVAGARRFITDATDTCRLGPMVAVATEPHTTSRTAVPASALPVAPNPTTEMVPQPWPSGTSMFAATRESAATPWQRYPAMASNPRVQALYLGGPVSELPDAIKSDHLPTITEWLKWIAGEYGDHTAVVGAGGTLTYRQLEEQSKRVAEGLLQRGLGKGSRVGLWLANGTEWVLTWAAVSRIGGVAVPLSTFLSDRELAKVARHADLQGLIVHRRLLGHDVPARMEKAFPSLSSTSGPPLALPEAPFLRWILVMEREDDEPVEVRPWSRSLDWLLEADGVFTELREQAESEVHYNDPAIMIYTSGSTADPKGVPHVHETVTYKTRYLRDFFKLTRNTRSYIVSPFCWVGGMTMSLFPVLDAGGTQYCTDRFDPAEILDLIESERLDRAVLYPQHVNRMLNYPELNRWDRSSLRDADPLLLVGEAAASRDPHKLSIGLGMTETFDGYWWGYHDHSTEAPLRPGERRPPPLDVILPGVEVKVVGPDGQPVPDGGLGEVCVRGFGITPGLHKSRRRDVFDDDGWFHTGDRGEVDGARVWFRGRLSEMIKTSGANVAPGEVVQALGEIEGVAAAHVVGLPDPIRGEVVAAAVVPTKGASLDVEVLRKELRGMLSPYKVPVHIVLLSEEDIPMTPSHKVRRGVLADMIRERISATGD
jgi:acyl-CoA synthetase (AMP-forming)/AMP-acid ligase II